MLNKLIEFTKKYCWLIVLVVGVVILRDGYNVLEATYFISAVVLSVLWFAW